MYKTTVNFQTFSVVWNRRVDENSYIGRIRHIPSGCKRGNWLRVYALDFNASGLGLKSSSTRYS